MRESMAEMTQKMFKSNEEAQEICTMLRKAEVAARQATEAEQAHRQRAEHDNRELATAVHTAHSELNEQDQLHSHEMEAARASLRAEAEREHSSRMESQAAQYRHELGIIQAELNQARSEVCSGDVTAARGSPLPCPLCPVHERANSDLRSQLGMS